MKLELLKGSRSRILAAAILIIVAVFAGRLFYLQIIQHSHYVALAEKEQVKRLTIPAQRGLIYAKNGDDPVRLVMNETVYTAFADPVTVSDKEKVVEVLRQVAGGNVREGFAELLDRTETRYQILATKLSRVQADKIKEADLNGIGFQAVSQRVYPEGSLAAQALGFVDTEGQGRYGIESYMNDALEGVDGRLESVTDVRHVPLTIGNRNIKEPAQDGKNIVMTIDRNIQSYVEQAIRAGAKRTGADEVSALVMDPRNGKILAMANLPTYKPAEYFNVKDVAAFNNATISSPYEPGSDVKTYTMAVGIDKGVVKASDTYNNTDYIRIEDRTITNATKGITGTISFQTAMNWSLNTGFVTVAQRLGNGKEITREARDTMYHYFHDRLRLGQLTGIELANESTGIIISPDQPDGNAVRYSNMAFGQGLDATMIQVSAGFSALINGGNFYKPTIIDGYMEDGQFIQNETPQPIQSSVISRSTSSQLKQMTHVARKSGFGHVDKPGYYTGGKTGTSQVIKDGRYSPNETIATYLGFGGGDETEYVIMIKVAGENKEMQGARDALPVFTDISNWLLDYLKIHPKG
jgi:stage V sporulation protein D (sporulation-specific penicillin-binding protein)